MTYPHSHTVMNHQLPSASPSVQGLNHALITGELVGGSFSEQPNRCFHGQLLIKADPVRRMQSSIVPFYATERIAERLHALTAGGAPAYPLDLAGIAHQKGYQGYTRIKVLHAERAIPGARTVNTITLGGTLTQPSTLSTNASGVPFVLFSLSINGDYLLDTGDRVIRNDQVNLCAYGDQALLIDRLAPGTVITVNASASGFQRGHRKHLRWDILFTAHRCTIGLKCLRNN